MAALIVGLFLAASPSKAAAATSCPSDVADALSITYPQTPVAFRRVEGSIDASWGSNYAWVPGETVSVSLFPGDSDEAYWTRTWSSTTDFWINFSRRNARYRLEVTATYTNFSQTCEVTKVRNLRTIKGLPIRVEMTPRVSGLNNGARFKWRCPTWNWDKINPDSLDFTIYDSSTYNFIFVKEWCNGSNRASKNKVEGANWILRADPLLSEVTLTFKKKRRPFKVTVVVSQDRRLSKVTFKARWLSRPSRRIWAGSDAYWNYCINKWRPIKVENGQFYCWTPDRSRYKVKVIRRPI